MGQIILTIEVVDHLLIFDFSPLLFFSQAGCDVSNLLHKPSRYTELSTERTLIRQG